MSKGMVLYKFYLIKILPAGEIKPITAKNICPSLFFYTHTKHFDFEPRSQNAIKWE
jgi:hypothetical protein